MSTKSPTNGYRPTPMTNPFKDFVHCLDTYQHKKNMNLQDAVMLFDTTQQYYQSQFSQYYQSLDGSSSNPYLVWQKQHEIVHFNPVGEFKVATNVNVSKKTYCHIDVSLNTIGDLLTLLKDNPYADDTEYNIDLKALHNIEPELQLFHGMVGNEPFKKSILRQLLYFLQKLDDSKNDYKHMVITGPPGTGKTEMAKIIGRMYSKLGILKKNVFKKVTRADLVAGYLGQTAMKTKKVIEECLDGVLFFDEAYSLSVDESYSKECIDTLCECLSDHRTNFMMIIAGYENELENSFFKINSGLKSRFIWRFDLEKYSMEELMQIFLKFVEESSWKCREEVNLKWFSRKKDSFVFNGRDMELLFSYVKIAHAQRIFGKSEDERKWINLEDMNAGFAIFQENKKTNPQEKLLSLYI